MTDICSVCDWEFPDEELEQGMCPECLDNYDPTPYDPADVTSRVPYDFGPGFRETA